MDNILEKFRDKRILIWGYGREGKSTEAFFKNHPVAASVEIFEGKPEEVNWDDYDYVFKSPGIRLKHAIRDGFRLEDPILAKLTSQTDLFLEAFRYRVIGVTGTKGKSTTSSLLYHVLDTCFKNKNADAGEGSDTKVKASHGRKYNRAFLVGNIGVPCLDLYDEMTKGDAIAVFELSCHQLAYTPVSPHIGIFLNLYEDHLDFYGDRENYFRAKRHITDFQSHDDYLYVGLDVPTLYEDVRAIHVRERYTGEMKLLGEHNRYNASFVFHVAVERFRLDPESVAAAIRDFTGLPHRLQFIGEKDGVKYYDDSISTIPEAAIQAAESVPDAVTMLIGGMDREIDYTPLKEFIPEHAEITFICMYESGKRVFNEVEEYISKLKNKPHMCDSIELAMKNEVIKDLYDSHSDVCQNIYLVSDLEAAVKLAKKLTPQGKACVLSPAAASYGYFKNFEERGDVFAKLVME